MKRIAVCLLFVIVCLTAADADHFFIGWDYSFFTVVQSPDDPYFAHQAGAHLGRFWGGPFGFYAAGLLNVTVASNTTFPRFDVTAEIFCGPGWDISLGETASFVFSFGPHLKEYYFLYDLAFGVAATAMFFFEPGSHLGFAFGLSAAYDFLDFLKWAMNNSPLVFSLTVSPTIALVLR